MFFEWLVRVSVFFGWVGVGFECCWSVLECFLSVLSGFGLGLG